MDPQETIQITLDRYMDMFRDVQNLQALEGAGVDNWDGYSEVDWDAIDEACKKEEESHNA